jgi:hypothetical protein
MLKKVLSMLTAVKLDADGDVGETAPAAMPCQASDLR